MNARRLMARTRYGFTMLRWIIFLPFRMAAMCGRALVAIGEGFVRFIANLYLALIGVAALTVIGFGVARLF